MVSKKKDVIKLYGKVSGGLGTPTWLSYFKFKVLGNEWWLSLYNLHML